MAKKIEFKDSQATESDRLAIFADATPADRLLALKEINHPAKVIAWTGFIKAIATTAVTVGVFAAWRLGLF